MIPTKLLQLYKEHTNEEPLKCEKIAGGGSNREYYRLTSADAQRTMIGAIGTSQEENESFVYLSRHLQERGLPVPMVYAVSEDRGAYLQADLGAISLYDALKEGRECSAGYSPEDIVLLERTIRLLPKIQVEGGKGMDFGKCYPQDAMNEQNVLFDLNYFKYCFLKTTVVDFNEMKLEADFQDMARHLGISTDKYFMYRDFQARNVMLVNGTEPYFIDYQGGRRGPLQYDLVSFLWQASSHFSKELREHLINVYIESLREYITFDEEEFRRSIPQWVLFRTLQVLGAYGFRGKFERKKYFLDSIPAAIENLKDVLEIENSCPYPYIYKVLKTMVSLPEFNTDVVANTAVIPNNKQSGLKVRVFSFSYKKGIPSDNSGNGGGYVFDCRSTHNPGRYEPYKKLTGLDKPVIDFLEKDGEITIFLESVYKLAEAHVERYIQRGFTSLMFCFGCTGGQHRSVYSAQHLAQHLNEKYGIEVEITHREQSIHSVLHAKKKAMIFAAGLGSRLKPITDHMPKALVEIAGKPLIEHVLRKLVLAGFNDIVINVHHFADMIEKWKEELAKNTFFKDKNIKISFSDEREQLLETGGGIWHAKDLLCENNPGHKVLIHNVDILSNLDIDKFCQFADNAVDACLVVSKRKTARYFVFNNEMQLVGWTNISTSEVKSPFSEVHEALANRESDSLDTNDYHLRAFAGIHLINTSIIKYMSEWPEKFSITDFYLKQCEKLVIKGYSQENLSILDVGKLDSINEAECFINKTQE